MSSSDIYEVKESPWAKKPEVPSSKHRNHSRQHRETFDEAVDKDLSATHRRRSRNSGVRRFQHLMKQPEFSKKFWIIALAVFGTVVGGLIIWDLFFHYPKQPAGYKEDIYRPKLM